MSFCVMLIITLLFMHRTSSKSCKFPTDNMYSTFRVQEDAGNFKQKKYSISVILSLATNIESLVKCCWLPVQY